MTLGQKEKIEKELTLLLKNKFSDIRTGVDYFEREEKIKISFFWNRINNEHFSNSKSFECHFKDYPDLIETTILPFFN